MIHVKLNYLATAEIPGHDKKSDLHRSVTHSFIYSVGFPVRSSLNKGDPDKLFGLDKSPPILNKLQTLNELMSTPKYSPSRISVSVLTLLQRNLSSCVYPRQRYLAVIRSSS